MSAPLLDAPVEVIATAARIRPTAHFTVRAGFTNDPHGILHVDGRYHMFFQHSPGATHWTPGCHWGHAVSDDLLHWEELDIALAPEPDEVGCWSGCAVVDDRGPVILYTRIPHGDWARGEVALARPRVGMAAWRRDPVASVIPGPPAEPGFSVFRDPQVRRDGDVWRAVVGGGLQGAGGCVAQFSSPDLHDWTFDGVIAERSADDHEPRWTGTGWECPQLLQVDGHWVLLFGVWDDHRIFDVAYALGDLVDGQFQARTWGTFTHGPELYATTTFTDADGHPCALSWIREHGDRVPEGSPWCGAMSLPVRLRVEGERLVATQHPTLDALLPPRPRGGPLRPGTAVDLGEVGPMWRLQLDLEPGARGRATVEVGEGADHWQLHADLAQQRVHVVRGQDGFVLMDMPLPAAPPPPAPSGTPPTDPAAPAPPAPSGSAPATLDIVVDADICEVTWSAGSGVGAVRVPAARSTRLRVHTAGCDVAQLRLSR